MQNIETPSAKGLHKFSFCDITSPGAKGLEHTIQEIVSFRQKLISSGKATREALRSNWEDYSKYLSLLHRNFLLREFVIENITCTVGRAVLAQRLGGDTTFTGTVTHTALGTDNTAAVVGDTLLGTETFRKALSSGTDSSNVAFLETFFSAAEVNGTFEEYGMFIDGTGSVDTGQLFNRFVQTVTKSNTESLNVQSTITFNDA